MEGTGLKHLYIAGALTEKFIGEVCLLSSDPQESRSLLQAWDVQWFWKFLNQSFEIKIPSETMMAQPGYFEIFVFQFQLYYFQLLKTIGHQKYQQNGNSHPNIDGFKAGQIDINFQLWARQSEFEFCMKHWTSETWWLKSSLSKAYLPSSPVQDLVLVVAFSSIPAFQMSHLSWMLKAWPFFNCFHSYYSFWTQCWADSHWSDVHNSDSSILSNFISVNRFLTKKTPNMIFYCKLMCKKHCQRLYARW